MAQAYGESVGDLERIPPMTKDDLMANFDAIVANVSPMAASYLPYFAGGCSRERMEIAMAFFDDPDHQIGNAGRNMAKVADQVTDCANIRQREGEAVANYLHRLAATGSSQAESQESQ